MFEKKKHANFFFMVKRSLPEKICPIQFVASSRAAFALYGPSTYKVSFNFGQWPKTVAPGRFLARNGWEEV